VTLTGLKRDGGGSEVSVVAEPATKVSDREIGLIAVSRGKGGLTGGRVTVHRARGMLAAGLVHRLHVCGE
jgi:tRNA A37 threonylcarbamoyladenosine modification protein TsaB